MKELQQKILKWADERNILDPNFEDKQRLKVCEEAGELSASILKNNREGIIDGIGDCAVVLIILAAQCGEKLELERNNELDLSSDSIYSLVRGVIVYDICGGIQHLHELASRFGLLLEDCLESAWDEIKDRKGTTQNGTFIKD